MPYHVEALVIRSETEDKVACGIYLSEPIENGGVLKRRVDSVYGCSVQLFGVGEDPSATATDSGSGFYEATFTGANRPVEGAPFLLSVTVQPTEASTPQVCEAMAVLSGSTRVVECH